jgi:hypothetical protein
MIPVAIIAALSCGVSAVPMPSRCATTVIAAQSDS